MLDTWISRMLFPQQQQPHKRSQNLLMGHFSFSYKMNTGGEYDWFNSTVKVPQNCKVIKYQTLLFSETRYHKRILFSYHGEENLKNMRAIKSRKFCYFENFVIIYRKFQLKLQIYGLCQQEVEQHQNLLAIRLIQIKAQHKRYIYFKIWVWNYFSILQHLDLFIYKYSKQIC